MIIPKEFLKTIKRSGLGFAAFAELRYTNALAVATIGEEVADERKEFILNTDPYKGKAKILIAGDNFGCGSSREHAPWAINDMGLRCIISNRLVLLSCLHSQTHSNSFITHPPTHPPTHIWCSTALRIFSTITV